jgi:hypothetical protein
MLDVDGKGVELAVDELVIVGHGFRVRIDEDDIEPLMILSRNAFGMLQKVFATSCGFVTE